MRRPVSPFSWQSSVASQVDSNFTEYMEITEEEHQRHMSNTTATTTSRGVVQSARQYRLGFRQRHRPRRLFARRGNMMETDTNGTQQQHSDTMSMGDLSRAIHGINQQYPITTPTERDTITLSGIRSVATFQTFSSHETVKASNKANFIVASGSKNAYRDGKDGTASKSKRRWKTFKKAVVKQLTSLPHGLARQNSSPRGEHLQQQQPGHFLPLRNRSRSNGSTSASTVHSECDDAMLESELCTPLEIRQSDVLMLGRHDGIDLLSLGPAFLKISSSSETNDPSNVEQSSSVRPWADWAHPSTGTAQIYDEKSAVLNMLRSASGQSTPDIVLEGFCREDRWILRIESGFEKALTGSGATPPDLCQANASKSPSSDDGGSPVLPVVKLWSRLWGSDPIPKTNFSTFIKDDSGMTKEEDPVLELAAQNSVPIDVDDDTFIVSTPQHMHTIHAIASVPISAGHMSAGIDILTKMLHGLGGATFCKDMIKENMRGATLCNIGLLHLWEGKNEEACDFFRLASEARKACPMVTKRDRVVSLVRHGQALFATKQLSASLSCFLEALTLTDSEADELLRAKVLVNAGVSSYLLDDFSQSLESFTQALAIQRKWLDKPIRRRGLVHEASITLSNMGKLYLERGDANMASFVYEEALLLEKSIFGKTHPFIITCLQNLAFAKARELQYGKAIKLLEKCRRLQGKHFETSTATPIMDTCGWMAHLHAYEGQTAQAKCLYETVLAWQKTFLPSQHPGRRRIEACLQQLPCTIPETATSWL